MQKSTASNMAVHGLCWLLRCWI